MCSEKMYLINSPQIRVVMILHYCVNLWGVKFVFGKISNWKGGGGPNVRKLVYCKTVFNFFKTSVCQNKCVTCLYKEDKVVRQVFFWSTRYVGAPPFIWCLHFASFSPGDKLPVTTVAKEILDLFLWGGLCGDLLPKVECLLKSEFLTSLPVGSEFAQHYNISNWTSPHRWSPVAGPLHGRSCSRSCESVLDANAIGRKFEVYKLVL